MATFPTLKTGAVVQYPIERHIGFNTEVLQFIDGQEQRFRSFGAPLRKWVIRLDLLDEGEVQSLIQFFDSAHLPTKFTFTDPTDGTTHSNCTVENPEFVAEYLDVNRSRTQMIIRENKA